MNGWSSALRIATREARRHRWRSLLVMLLVALPVGVSVGVVAVLDSHQVDGREALVRVQGSAEARVRAVHGAVEHGAYPFTDGWWSDVEAYGGGPVTDPEEVAVPTEDDLRRVLGDDVRVERVQLGGGYEGGDWTEVRVGDKAEGVEYRVADLGDPLTKGLAELLEGTLPSEPGEVAVNPTLAAYGFEVGDTLQTRLRDEPFTVTAVAEDASLANQSALFVAPFPESRWVSWDWLVGPADGAPADAAEIGPEKIAELNELGFVVSSRAVADDPSQLPDGSMDEQWGTSSEDVATVVLVVTMVLIEIALLAGPAFAVTARQQARSVALMSVNGATPAQARRVVLAAALVLGGVGAVVGAVLGVVGSYLAIPLVERQSYERFGEFGVPWWALVGITAFGVLAAVVSAAVPAWLASRQDPVAVMNGRRSDKVSSQQTRRSAVVGSATLVLGVLLMVGAVTADGDDAASIVLMTVAVVVTALGMVVVAPSVTALVARVLGERSFVARYTSRDAVRHRTRTVPAIAAVAATVAGVVALGVAWETDAAHRADWDGRSDVGEVGWSSTAWDAEAEQALESTWDALEERVRAELPDLRASRLTVLPQNSFEGAEVTEWGDWSLVPVGAPADWVLSPDEDEDEGLDEDGYVDDEPVRADLSAPLVSDRYSDLALPADRAVPGRLSEQVDTALAAGHVVEFVPEDRAAPAPEGPLELRLSLLSDDLEDVRVLARTPVTVTRVPVARTQDVPASLVVPSRVAEAVDVPVRTEKLVLHPMTDPEDGDTLVALAEDVDEDFWVDAVRTQASDDEALLVMLVLSGAAMLLMGIGTLSATMLALTDADADLATLSAVGAAPVTRRGIARGYALLISGVGAVLGVVVGLVPGVAVGSNYDRLSEVELPWLLMAVVVVGVPLLTALLVGLFTRARMPLVRRVA